MTINQLLNQVIQSQPYPLLFVMKTGITEANLVNLNQEFKLPYLAELIEQKTQGKEKSVLSQLDLNFHEQEYQRLQTELAIAQEKSHLPDNSSAKETLNEFVIRFRMS